MERNSPNGEAPRPTSLRDRQRELTRQALLEGARPAFEERGYADVTIDDIAGRAGTSRGTFYLHFTKAGVLAELLTERIPAPPTGGDGRTTTSLATADLSSRAAIRECIQPFVDLWQNDRPLARAYMEGDATDPDLRAITDDYYAATVNDLVDQLHAIHGEALGKKEAQVRATIMVFTVQSFTYHVLGRDHETDLDLSLNLIADQWLRLLNDPPTRPVA